MSRSLDNTIKIWNFETGIEINSIADHNTTLNSMTISSDNKYIVTGSYENSI